MGRKEKKRPEKKLTFFSLLLLPLLSPFQKKTFKKKQEGFLALPYNLGRFSAFGRALQARQRVLERIDGLIDKAVKKASSSSSSSSSPSSSSVASPPASSSSSSAAAEKSKKRTNKGKNALALMLSAVDPETGERATRGELRDQILTQVRVFFFFF